MLIKRTIGFAVATAVLASLALAPGAMADIRVGANYRLTSDSNPFRGKDQVSMAVNPGNPSHIVQVNSNYLTQLCEGTASFDGGVTWTPAAPLQNPSAPLGWREFCSSFQSLEFGSGMNVYFTAATARVNASANEEGASVLVWRSQDGGVNWGTGVVAMAGGPNSANQAGGPSYTRPGLGVHIGGGPGGADRIYVAAQDFLGTGTQSPPCPTSTCAPTKVAVSNDNGVTWGTAVNATPPATTTIDGPSEPIVHSDGSVSVAWRTIGINATIQIARSTDQGANWGTPVDVTGVTNWGTSTASHIRPDPATGQSTSASYPRIVRGPAPGQMYMVFSQSGEAGRGPTDCGASCWTGSDHFISPDAGVWFQRSNDFGATWSEPKKINDTTTYPGSELIQTRHPSISVSPGGRINIVWHDRRHWYQERLERTCTHSHIYCTEIRLGDTYMSYSTDGGNTFSPNIRINDRSHNNDTGYDTRPIGYWAFAPQAVTVANGRLLVGFMDTREGNWDTDTEDTYLARVDFEASGSPPQTFVDRADVISRSVGLSQLAYPAGNEGALNGVSNRNGTKVVIVNESHVAGALAGSVLARANPGPMLLSPASGLPTSVRNEVTRMSPTEAYVIGDTSRLSAQVEADLLTAGVPPGKVTRITGADDAALAAAIAGVIDRRTAAEDTANQSAFDAAIIANPNSPDAAAAAGLAAARRLPFLFVDTNSTPAATTAALTARDIDETLVIGNASVIASTAGLPNPTRLGGADQYGTSQAVVTESKSRGLPTNVAYVASGTQPLDAALLAGMVARATGVMLLAPPPLSSNALSQVSAFGLTSAGGTAGTRLVDRVVAVGSAPSTGGGGGGGGGDTGGGGGGGDTGGGGGGDTGGGGGDTGTPATPGTTPGPAPDTSAPAVSGVTFRSRFRVAPAKARASQRRAPAGTTIRFRLSEAARVSIAFAKPSSGRRRGSRCVRPTRALRRARRCTLLTTRGTVNSSRPAGATSVRFSGRLRGRALRPGRYQFSLRATDTAGNRSRPIVRTFTIVR